MAGSKSGVRDGTVSKVRFPSSKRVVQRGTEAGEVRMTVMISKRRRSPEEEAAESPLREELSDALQI